LVMVRCGNCQPLRDPCHFAHNRYDAVRVEARESARAGRRAELCGRFRMRPKMTLPRYLEIASRLPLPTHEQIEAYIRYIHDEHSWYKHLPILPPGRPFHFFLDPGAGMTRVVREDGQFCVKPRSDAERYHHAWFSTVETRARFGHLSYAVVYPRPEVLDHDLPSLMDPELGIDVHLPREAVEVARTDVSGLIHPHGTNHYLILQQSRNRTPAWPPESGGQDQAKKIRARCRALVEGNAPLVSAPANDTLDERTRRSLMHSDWTLYQMLASERQRQHEAMVKAALRAVAFVHGT
jgi:hypothetical protein